MPMATASPSTVGWVMTHPTALVANLSRAGLSTCKVHAKEFPSDCFYVISSPLPRLCLAQQDLTPKPYDYLFWRQRVLGNTALLPNLLLWE